MSRRCVLLAFAASIFAVESPRAQDAIPTSPQSARPNTDANGNQAEAEPSPPPAAAGDIQEVDRVVITGTNITTSESPPFVPESIFNREVVERSGSRSVGDFLRSIPQNSGPGFTENQNESLSPGGAAVALRGLSPDATLVLINGRRVAPYPFAQAASQRSSI
jgi:iron complex outermembrane receptor protein